MGEIVLEVIVFNTGVDWTGLFDEVQQDPLLKQITTDPQNIQQEYKGFSLVEWRLLYKGRVVIP